MTELTNDRNILQSAHTGLKYLLIGGGLGAAAALLFAPKSGSDTRHDISDATRRGYDGTLDLARRVKDQSTGIYHSLVDKMKRAEEGSDEILELDTSTKKIGRKTELVDRGSKSAAGSRNRDQGRRASSII